MIRYSIVCRLAGLYMFYMIRPSICKDNAFAEMSSGDIVILDVLYTFAAANIIRL